MLQECIAESAIIKRHILSGRGDRRKSAMIVTHRERKIWGV